jgi:hypothetical protein
MAADGSLSAMATFNVAGGDLHIRLSNISGVPVGSNPEVLSGLFFDLAGDPSLSAGSLSLVPGSFYVHTPPSFEPADQHWAFAEATGSGLPHYRIGAAGFGLFDGADTFAPGGGDPIMDGVDYGLVGQLATNPSAGLKKPLIDSAVDIVLKGSLASLPEITNVSIQYGSSLLETRLEAEAIPEPGLYAFVAGALIGAVPLWRLRKRRK